MFLNLKVTIKMLREIFNGSIKYTHFHFILRCGSNYNWGFRMFHVYAYKLLFTHLLMFKPTEKTRIIKLLKRITLIVRIIAK